MNLSSMTGFAPACGTVETTRWTWDIKAVAGPAPDGARLYQETVPLAAKADVREEIDRLAIHRAAARALLDKGGPIGRRLDFLAQEPGREAATLCAKSNDSALTGIGLELRAQVDQFREQVQNLE